jgi:hypothetical protein
VENQIKLYANEKDELITKRPNERLEEEGQKQYGSVRKCKHYSFQ